MFYLPNRVGPPRFPAPLTGMGLTADPTRDRGTFLGATNFLAVKINRRSPQARFIILGHYESAGKSNIALGQEVGARALNLQLLPLQNSRLVAAEGGIAAWPPKNGAAELASGRSPLRLRSNQTSDVLYGTRDLLSLKKIGTLFVMADEGLALIQLSKKRMITEDVA